MCRQRRLRAWVDRPALHAPPPDASAHACGLRCGDLAADAAALAGRARLLASREFAAPPGAQAGFGVLAKRAGASVRPCTDMDAAREGGGGVLLLPAGAEPPAGMAWTDAGRMLVSGLCTPGARDRCSWAWL